MWIDSVELALDVEIQALGRRAAVLCDYAPEVREANKERYEVITTAVIAVLKELVAYDDKQFPAQLIVWAERVRAEW